MSESINFIKQKVNPEIEKVHYFSDVLDRTKTNNIFLTYACLHKMDFDVDCVWNFFATSHGKSPCDGIGGTIKRLATKASLQRPIDNQILNASDMYKFCNDNIKGISFCIVNGGTMNYIRASLVERFQAVKTVPGTRSYHQYEPINENVIRCKRVSSDIEFDLKFELFSDVHKATQVSISNHVLCIYDEC